MFEMISRDLMVIDRKSVFIFMHKGRYGILLPLATFNPKDN